MSTQENGAGLLAAQRDPAPYLRPVRRVELVQTHISWVLLTGNAVARGEAGADIVEALARKVAAFHAALPPAAPHAGYDASAAVLAPAVENFEQIRPLLEAPDDIAALNAIRAWTLQEF